MVRTIFGVHRPMSPLTSPSAVRQSTAHSGSLHCAPAPVTSNARPHIRRPAAAGHINQQSHLVSNLLLFTLGILVAPLISGTAIAQTEAATWERVSNYHEPQIEVLRESVKASNTDANNVAITWRHLTGETIVESVAEADCANFVLTNLARTRKINWLPTAAPASTTAPPLRERPLHFAYFGSLEGSIVKFACSLARPRLLDQLESADGVCSSASYRDMLTCTGGGELRANVRLFMDRTAQLRSVCNESPESIEILQSTYIREAEACSNHACAERAIVSGLRAISRDLETETDHRICQAATNARQLTEDRELVRRQEIAMLDYVVCAGSQTKIIDDIASSAETVARRVYAACSAKMQDVLAAFGPALTEDQFYASTEPRLIALVQKNRAKP